MKTSRWILALLGLLGAAAVQAQGMQMQKPMSASGPWSAEFAYAPLTVSAAGGSISANVGRFLLGYRVLPNLEIEGMVAASAGDVDVGGYVSGRLTQSVGLFIKPGMDVGPGMRAYLRVGSINSRVEATSGGVTDSGTKQTTAYGIGLSYRMSDPWALTLDYMRYARIQGVTVSGPSLGIAYSF